jgi:hypothetical protein
VNHGQRKLARGFPEQFGCVDTFDDTAAATHQLVMVLGNDVVTLNQTQRCAGGVSQRIQRMTRGVQPGLAHDRLAFMH